MTRELDDIFDPVHPLSGYRSGRGPDNPYRIQDSERRQLGARFGQLCEAGVIKAWTDQLQIDNEQVQTLKQSASAVRKRLVPLNRRVYVHSHQVASCYRGLSEAPEIPFIGSERTWPSWEPLRELFETVDNIFGTPLMRDFSNLGQDFVEPRQVSPKVSFLVQSALILARAATQPPIFKNSEIVPNYWVNNGHNVAQFDAILLPLEGKKPQLSSNNRSRIDLTDTWYPLEIKVDFRTRHNTGPQNRLDVGKPPRRHIVQLQEKLARTATSFPDDFRFPDNAFFVYLRGTRKNVVHSFPFDRGFLSNWKFALDIGIDNFHTDPDLCGRALLLSHLIDIKLDELQERKAEMFRPFDPSDYSQVSLPFEIE